MEGSIKKVWWVCSKGHEYRMSIKDKTLKNSKCPYCSNVKAYAGFNDLLTTNPDIAKEWDYTNNGELKPSDVLAGSHKKVWWVCKNKHHYQAIVKSRTSGSGCPFCSKHMKTSFPEQAVFYYVNKLFSDAINGYIISDRRMELDIYIPSKKIGIEYDGSNYHNDNKSLERDNKKYSICKTKCITLIRLSEKEKTSSLRKCDYRINVISRQSDDLNKAIDELANYLGKNISSNVDKDRNDILINLDKRNINLAEKYPFIINEWNYEKNKPLLPENVSPSSNTVVWWKCDKGHEWKSTIANRTSHSKKCPYCANVKLLKGFNDLSTTNPKLASEWNYSKNGNKKPSDYFGHANIIVWWKCDKGHEWKTTINSRSYGSNCPYCAKQKVLSGINDLATLKPEVLSKWNYQKNTIEPKDVFAHSSKMVWWICDKGHEWQAPVSRVSKGSDCPYCSNAKLLSGYNDLQTINPSLAREWNYRKNGTLKPSQVLFGSAKKVWWVCSKGHEWRTQINVRNNGCNCPICSRKMINSSSKRKVLMIDLKTNQVIKEFDSISDASKSIGVSPSNISAVCLKKPKRKSCGGYKWKFKE